MTNRNKGKQESWKDHINKKELIRIQNHIGQLVCAMCKTVLNTNNSKGKLYEAKTAEICGKCYLQWRREVRQRRGEG
tara:strand:+ start:21018 stop:21248 length:231 start_codon:yes stop_codon:yes gene_type:complete